MRLVKWQKKRARFLLETFGSHTNIMAIDPGNKGGGLVFTNGIARESFVFRGVTGYHQVAPLVRRYEIGLFILEDAFAGKGLRAALKLGFWRGYVTNEIAHACPWPTTVIEVSPSTWQARLPRDGLPQHQPWDRDAKTFATWQVAEHYLGERPDHDAVASACGIGHWWLSLSKEYRNE